MNLEYTLSRNLGAKDFAQRVWNMLHKEVGKKILMYIDWKKITRKFLYNSYSQLEKTFLFSILHYIKLDFKTVLCLGTCLSHYFNMKDMFGVMVQTTIKQSLLPASSNKITSTLILIEVSLVFSLWFSLFGFTLFIYIYLFWSKYVG